LKSFNQSRGVNSDIFEAEVAKTDEIKFWLMSWGSYALALEPESLRDDIGVETETMLEKYSKGTDKEERPLMA